MPNFSNIRDELIVSGEASCLDNNNSSGLKVKLVNKSILSHRSIENGTVKLKDRNLIHNSKIQGQALRSRL